MSKATVVIQADHPGLAFTDGHARYTGVCPACQEATVIDRNVAKCGVCGVEFTACIVRPYLREPYLLLRF